MTVRAPTRLVEFQVGSINATVTVEDANRLVDQLVRRGTLAAWKVATRIEAALAELDVEQKRAPDAQKLLDVERVTGLEVEP